MNSPAGQGGSPAATGSGSPATSGGQLTGRWEAAVAQVVIAGQPTTIHHLAQAWQQLADGMPDHQRELGKLVEQLCGGSRGWHGPAATEYRKIVEDLSKKIGDLVDDCTQMGKNLDTSADYLSHAVAKIPVPLVRVGGWGYDHQLPNGTEMDDNMGDAKTFMTALIDDYGKNPGMYRDFREFMRNNYGTHMRVAHSGDDDYSGHGYGHQDAPSDADIDKWYYPNAAVADSAFGHLRQQYTDQRPRYDFPADVYGWGQQGDASDGGSAGDGLGDGSSYDAGSFGAGSVGAAGAGSAWTPDSAQAGSVPDWAAEHGAVGAEAGPSAWGDSGSGPGWGAGPAPSGTELSGQTGGGVGAGFGGGIGGVGSGGPGSLGVVSPGSHISGPDQPPMPPATTVQQSMAERGVGAGRAGAGRPGGTGGVGGIMPGGAGGRRDRDERTTWLTEDEDIFRTKEAPPGLIE